MLIVKNRREHEARVFLKTISNIKQHRFIQHKYLHVMIEVCSNDIIMIIIFICTRNKARLIY